MKLLTMHSSTSLRGSFNRVHGRDGVWLAGGFAAGNEILLPDAAGDLWKWEGVESTAHGAIQISAHVSVSEAADEDLVERGPGDYAELSEFGDGLRQPPVGDARAHAALNNLREPGH